MGILTADMQRVVNEEQLGFMATVCPDGTPNVSPKGTTAVYDDDHLIFADMKSPGTVRNLKQNPNIEINVIDVLVRRGYRFKGTATVHAEGEVFERALEIYAARGLKDYRERMRNVVLVKVERALAVTSPAYDLGLSEDEIRADYSQRFREKIDGHVAAP